MSQYLQFNKHLKVDQSQEKLSMPYYQRLVCNQKKMYAYKLLGLAKLDNSIYKIYKILQPPNILPQQDKFPLESGIKYQDLHPDQQNDYINGKINALLIVFLVKTYKALKAYGIHSSKYFEEIFGDSPEQLKNQNRQKYMHFSYLMNIVSKYIEKEMKEIMASEELQKPRYSVVPDDPKILYLQQSYESNLLNKLQILPRKQKINRIQKLKKCKLWNIRIAKNGQDYYVIERFYQDLTLDTYINEQEKLVVNLEEKNKKQRKSQKKQKLKLFGRCMHNELMYYSQDLKGSHYLWVQPKNIIVEKFKDKYNYHLSVIPPLLYCLGLSQEPMSAQLKFIYLTPKEFDLYKSPEQFSPNTNIDSRTITWKFILLLDHFFRLKHLYSDCINREQMKNRYKCIEKELSEEQFVGMIIKSLKKLKKQTKWQIQQARPSLQDLGHFFLQEVSTKSLIEVQFSANREQMHHLQKQICLEMQQLVNKLDPGFSDKKKNLFLYFLALIIQITLTIITTKDKVSQYKSKSKQLQSYQKLIKQHRQNRDDLYRKILKDYQKIQQIKEIHDICKNVENLSNMLDRSIKQLYSLYQSQQDKKQLNFNQNKLMLKMQLLYHLKQQNTGDFFKINNMKVQKLYYYDFEKQSKKIRQQIFQNNLSEFFASTRRR